MREFMLASLVVLTAGAASAETRDLSNFTSVNVSGRYRAEIAVGESYSVTLDGADAARLRTVVEDGVLKIEPARRPWFGEPRYDVHVRVTLPRLDGVAAARGATVRAAAGGPCTSFSAAAAMGADLDVVGISCETVEAAAAMGADLDLAGECGALDISAAMGADADADALRCRTVDASAAMGAGISAYASITYDAAASMGADVRIRGEARQGDRSAVMGGSVTSKN